MADDFWQDPYSPAAQGYSEDEVGNLISPYDELGTYVPPSETVQIIQDTSTGMSNTLTPEQTQTMAFYDYLISQYPDFYLDNIDQAILDAQILTNYDLVGSAFAAAGLTLEDSPWQRYNSDDLGNYYLYSTYGGDWGGTGYGGTDILRYETNSIWGAYTGTTRDFSTQLMNSLGLSYEQMIRAGQEAWQEHYAAYGQGYTEASSPLDIATAIGNKMLAMAGYPTTQFFTDEQLAIARQDAQAVQDQWKSQDEADSGFGQIMDIVSTFMSGPGTLLALAGGITTVANMLLGTGVYTGAGIAAETLGETTAGMWDAATLAGMDANTLLQAGASMSVEEAFADWGNVYEMNLTESSLQNAALEAGFTTDQIATMTMQELYDATVGMFDGGTIDPLETGGDYVDTTVDPTVDPTVTDTTFDPSLDPNFDGTDINAPSDTPTQTPTDGSNYGYEVGSPETTGGYDIYPGEYPSDPWWQQIIDQINNIPGVQEITDILTGSGAGGGLLGTLTGGIEQLLSDFLGGGDGGGGLLDLLNDAFGAYAAYDYSDKMQDMLNMGIEAVRWKDPFWDALAKNVGSYGIGGTAYGDAIANNVSRTQAAQGYDLSGNMLHELAGGLNDASLDAIRTFDTAARPTSNVYGDMFSSFGPAISSQWMNTSGAIGNLLGGNTTTSGGGFDWGSVFDTAWDWLGSGGSSSGSTTDWTGWDWSDLGGIYT